MEPRRESGRFLWGIVLLILGLLFLASNFGYGWFLWDRWWPLILIAIGVVMLYRRAEREGGLAPSSSVPSAAPGAPGEVPPAAPAPPVRRSFPTGAIILIGIGVAFLLQDRLGGSAFPALVLIAIGIALILRERAR